MGSCVGWADGSTVGSCEGCADGSAVGSCEGCADGSAVGSCEGSTDGSVAVSCVGAGSPSVCLTGSITRSAMASSRSPIKAGSSRITSPSAIAAKEQAAVRSTGSRRSSAIRRMNTCCFLIRFPPSSPGR